MRYGHTWATRRENTVNLKGKAEVILAQNEHIDKVSVVMWLVVDTYFI